MAADLNSTERDLQLAGIEESLQQILRSSRFKDASQLQSLLKFIVESSINGHDDALKERIIGMSVFGRRPDYETADDPIVRSRVGQLRKRLEQYHESEESKGAKFKIVIPSGTYKPTFILARERHEGSHSRPLENESQSPTSNRETMESGAPPSGPRAAGTVHWRTWGIAGISVCVLLVLAWAGSAKLRETELDLFWKPVLDSNKPVLICNGTITAFRPSRSFWNRVLPPVDPGDLEQPGSKTKVPALTAGQVITSQDLEAIPNGFMTPGDLAATTSITTLLNSRRRSYDLRTEANLPLVDLQASPAVLIGAFNNSWTMDLTRNLPFFFDNGGHIRERGDQHRFWTGKGYPDDVAEDDYAVIARILDSKTKQPVIVLAGKRNCGTEAAGEFATDPTQMKQLRTLSRDALENKSLELVLHVSLDHCKPTSVNIVASKTW